MVGGGVGPAGIDPLLVAAPESLELSGPKNANAKRRVF